MLGPDLSFLLRKDWIREDSGLGPTLLEPNASILLNYTGNSSLKGDLQRKIKLILKK